MAITRYNGCMPGTMTHDILDHRVSSRFVSELGEIPYGIVVEQGSEDNYITQPDGDDQIGLGASSGVPIGVSVIRQREPIECGVPAGVNKSRCTLNVLELPKGVNFKDYWEKNESVSVVETGTVYMRAATDITKNSKVRYVASGADLTVNAADENLTKYLGMASNAGTLLPNAKFETSCLAGELVLVRLNK